MEGLVWSVLHSVRRRSNARRDRTSKCIAEIPSNTTKITAVVLSFGIFRRPLRSQQRQCNAPNARGEIFKGRNFGHAPRPPSQPTQDTPRARYRFHILTEDHDGAHPLPSRVRHGGHCCLLFAVCCLVPACWYCRLACCEPRGGVWRLKREK